MNAAKEQTLKLPSASRSNRSQLFHYSSFSSFNTLVIAVITFVVVSVVIMIVYRTLMGPKQVKDESAAFRKKHDEATVRASIPVYKFRPDFENRREAAVAGRFPGVVEDEVSMGSVRGSSSKINANDTIPRYTHSAPHRLHPLQLARLHAHRPSIPKTVIKKGNKQKRKRVDGDEETIALEDYMLTNDLPYEDIRVLTVPSDGNCLFHCVRKVLTEIRVDTRVRDLRAIVARSVGESELDFLQSIYNSAVQNGDRGIMNDYGFMNGVQTVPDLRHAIMQPIYYGDEMALRALERAYPVKFLVLQMRNNDRDIELMRRFSEDEDLDNKPWFSLLLLDAFAQHYELVSYKDKVSMRRHELPDKLQRLLTQQKVERELASQQSKELKKEAESPRPKTITERLVRAPLVRA